MTLQQVVDKIIEKPYILDMGKNKVAKWLKTSPEMVKAAKKEARKYVSYVRNNNVKKLPKILIFDIETSPTIAYTWRRFQENISLNQVIQDPIMLTWSAKWLYNTEIMSDSITVEEVKNYDDYRIVKSLWDLIDKADIVVAHYGDKFDIPMLNSRAVINGLPPYSTKNSIDTKKVASKTFKFPSNKLDGLATYFKVGNKIKTDFDLWKHCLEGSDVVRGQTIEKMRVYNVQDVVVLEEVYLKLRPWIKAHPNVGVYLESDEPVCSVCGNSNIKFTGKFYYTNTGKYPEYRCSCGALTRGRRTVYDKNKRKQLLTSVGK